MLTSRRSGEQTFHVSSPDRLDNSIVVSYLLFYISAIRNINLFLANITTLCSPYGTSDPSVCLSSVTLVDPTQRFELFGNMFAPINSLGIRTLCLKFLRKIRRGSMLPCKLNVTGGMKIGFFDQYRRLVRKREKIRPYSYNGSRIRFCGV